MSKKPEADYSIGGGWGDAIQWNHDPDKLMELFPGAEFEVIGWKDVKPVVGQTLVGEFTKSWVVFEFTRVREYRDPPDMFNATVRAIEQVPKA